MDSQHEHAIRQTTILAFHLVAIERALDAAETLDEYRFLPATIRQHLASAEQIAADDLNRCRRIMRGEY